MFVLALIADTIRIPPALLSQPTLTSIHSEIEKRYPNRVILDVGLVICPYAPPLKIGDGVLVPGDGGAHHEVIFQCVVFRPFVEEVLLGTVKESNEEGVSVSVGGFFDHVFIPAYWMLNPSKYDETTGLWVWTPNYDDNEEDDDENDVGEKEESEENRFEIEIGSDIRFKVKAVNFTRITTTMKGVQATTTTTSHISKLDMNRALNLNAEGKSSSSGAASSGGNANGEGDGGGDVGGAVRRRSSSADLSDSASRPAPMQIVGSICEDGLGLISWWKTAEEEEEEEEEEYEDGEGNPRGEEEG